MYVYWFTPEAYREAETALPHMGFTIEAAALTPCQVLRASGKTVIAAAPEVWSRLCIRQGSWYRQSKRLGQYLLLSAQRLPAVFETFLDAEIATSHFQPDALPTDDELMQVVQTEAYQQHKPKEWEAIGLKDALLFKVFFTLTRFWGRRDGLKTRWLGHRANHANFLSHTFTIAVDGEDVPYSITDNAGVCSSCAEFFNIVEDRSRKLVRACPGSVTFGGVQRDVYYDVKPKKDEATPETVAGAYATTP